jgi:hypothetical protein
MRHVNRVVIGVSEEKKSAVIYRDPPNQQGERLASASLTIIK